MSSIGRPDPSEYAPHFGRYIDLVPVGDIVATLTTQGAATVQRLRSLSESQGGFRYGPDKWSIKELVGHLTDAERIFATRALRFGRGDATELPGFEENDYVKNADFDSIPLSELTDGFEAVRRSTLSLLGTFSDESSKRRGKANGAEISARALAHVIAGHELHHLNVLQNRYVPVLPS